MNQSASSAPSGPIPLAPKTFGQIIDRTYRLMRTHLRLFLGIAAVPSAAIILVVAAVLGFMLISIASQLGGSTTATPTFLPGYWVALVCIYVISPLVYAFYMPAASYAATQADLGVTVTFLQAYGVAWRRFGRFLWLMILCSLIVIVPLAVVVSLVSLGALLLHNIIGPDVMFFLIPVFVLLYLAYAVYCILILLRFALVFPACVMEELTAWASLKRSAKLTQGAKGRIFLVLLLVYAITYVVTMVCILILFVLAALIALVAILVHVSEGSPAFYILIGLGVFGYLLSIAISILVTYAAYATALAVLYNDQRLRKDGLLPAPAQAGGAV
jgi:hypothetical protein